MIRPILMGAMMGAMMLWMLHDQIMTGGVSIVGTSLAFVAAHVAVIGLIALSVLFIPRVRTVVGKHRPSLAHFGLMLIGMASSVVLIHLTQHGVFV